MTIRITWLRAIITVVLLGIAGLLFDAIEAGPPADAGA